MRKKEQWKIEYLRDHVAYELEMMRHSYDRMVEAEDQSDRNSFFEAFAIHARNLYWFLRNNSEHNYYKASDFAKNYRRPNPDKVKGIADKISKQVAHISSQRTIDEENKINFSNAKEIADWIDHYVFVFASKLDDCFVPHFNPGKHFYKPSRPGTTASSATNAITTTSAVIGDTKFTFDTRRN